MIEIIEMVEKHNTLITINYLGFKLQTTPRDGAEHCEGEADAQSKRGQRTRRQHPVPAGDWVAGRVRKGGGEQACGWWRQVDRGREPWTV